jgi:hypothetical protein
MDEQRALLDQLMGRTRDVPDNLKKSIATIRFTDKRVCKYYLCGLCPYSCFSGTKTDLGVCPFEICGDNTEAEECKRVFNQLSPSERDRYGYEWDLLKLLDDLIRGCDRKIERHKERAGYLLEDIYTTFTSIL